ncbi:hypothetical protein [Paenibacillus tepidiphilus]|uniref:hypothetical protein n=1 Tax=Paenibacillus tepidiphilus TaxID=2608683 RepID=UPI00123C7459|nr:hypothetical protein [Paenibacillus tepidiphilus]
MYHEKKYISVDSYRARQLGEKLGAIVQGRTSVMTFYALSGIEPEQYICKRIEGININFIYKEVGVPDLTLSDFDPNAVEFNNNGKIITDRIILDKVIRILEGNKSLNTLEQDWLLEKAGQLNIDNVSLYSNKYPNFIFFK